MQTYWNGLVNAFSEANGAKGLWVLGLSALIYLALFEKEKRGRFVLPSLLLTVFALNPITYALFGRLHLAYVYWRVFWLIPLLPVLAAAGVSLSTRLREGGWKIAGLLFLTLLVLFAGQFVYQTRDSFRRLENPYRIPQEAATVGDALLAIDPEPYVVPTPYLGVSLRQYSTDIHQMYGRDFYGYIGQADETAMAVGEELVQPDPDLAFIAREMRTRGYDYLIRVRMDGDEERFPAAGFEKVADVERYGIYHLNG